MLTSLLLSALLMGLGGLPHCAAMCAAPCAAALPRGVPWPALIGRTVGYALLGAVAAGASTWLASWSRWVGVLQPAWVMALTAAALLGAWMACTGRLPSWLQEQGATTYRRLQAAMSDEVGALEAGSPVHKMAVRRAMPLLLGMAWAALPCGLLYSAVVLATLAPSARDGALVMGVFSLPGAAALYGISRAWRLSKQPDRPQTPPALAIAPVLWLARDDGRSSGRTVPAAAPAARPRALAGAVAWLSDPRWAVRSSGAMLSAAAAWALGHRLHEQWLIWCA